MKSMRRPTKRPSRRKLELETERLEKLKQMKAAQALIDAQEEKLAELRHKAEKASLLGLISYVIEWRHKLLDVATTYDELGTKAEEAWDMIQGIGSIGSGLHDYLQGGARDVKAMAKAFESLSNQAQNFGFRIDMTGKTLEQTITLVQDLALGFADFSEQMADVSSGMADLTGNTTTWGEETVSAADEAATSWGAARQEADSLQAKVAELYATKWADAGEMTQAAGEIVSAYQEIESEAKRVLGDLKREWQSLGEVIAEVEEKMRKNREDTADRLLALQRRNMTEEEVWQSKRAEYERTYNEAATAMTQGRVDSALTLYEKAKRIAQELASEISDAEGNTIRTLQSTTTTAMSLLQQAANGVDTALSMQREVLVSQQEEIRNQAGLTQDSIRNLGNQIGQTNEQAAKLQTYFTNPNWFKSNAFLSLNFLLNQDIPERFKADKFADGGPAYGRTHAQGGIPAELEDEEFVMKRKATRFYGMDAMHPINEMLIPRETLRAVVAGLSAPKRTVPWKAPSLSVQVPRLFAASGGAVSSAGYRPSDSRSQTTKHHHYTINIPGIGSASFPTTETGAMSLNTLMQELDRLGGYATGK